MRSTQTRRRRGCEAIRYGLLGATVLAGGCRLTPFSDEPAPAPVVRSESPVAAQTMSRDEVGPVPASSAPSTSNVTTERPSASSATTSGNAGTASSDYGSGASSANASTASDARSDTTSGPISSVPQPTLAPTEQFVAAGVNATVVPPTHSGAQPVLAVIDARCVPAAQRCGDLEASLSSYGWVACVPVPPRCDASAPPTSAPSLSAVVHTLEQRHPGSVSPAGVIVARGVDQAFVAQARASEPERWPFVIAEPSAAKAESGRRTNAPDSSSTSAPPLRVAMVQTTAAKPARQWGDGLQDRGASVQWFETTGDRANTTRAALAWVLTGQDLASTRDAR